MAGLTSDIIVHILHVAFTCVYMRAHIVVVVKFGEGTHTKCGHNHWVWSHFVLSDLQSSEQDSSISREREVFQAIKSQM